MSERDKEEFVCAVRQISYHSMHLDNPYDRVRVSEWIRRLIALGDDNNETCKKKNEFIQLLRINVAHSFLQPPFTDPPPDDNLPPLLELMGNIMSKKIPDLPRTGLISPAVVHQSPDGRAYISVKQIPKHGVLCYMAVNSNTPTVQKQ